MKRKEFIRQLMRDGCVLLRSGSRHDIYFNPQTGQKQPVPRHAEIDDHLARHIRSIWVLAAPSGSVRLADNAAVRWRPLHIQVAYERMRMVTVYEPDPTEWVDGRYRRRSDHGG